jgi:hypothetical protein
MRGFALVALLLLAGPAGAADGDLWALLRTGGQVVVMRHAITTSGSAIHPATGSTTARPSGT